MREISTTVTVGLGSEVHNHDLEYRQTLQHVHSCPEGVVELIPYVDYREQINALAKPYIDAYNDKVDARYQAAWDRYNAGQIKTKPRRRDYKKVGYDYYNEHLHDTYHNKITGKDEELPMWRSIILGLGDKEDRDSCVITEAEARATCAKAVEKFRQDFPYFHLLGASLHLDEDGFYHCHIDYKPFYENEIGQGLGFAVSHEGAMKMMGLEPEQSIINGRDKVPLRFNAFRNRIYYAIEAALADCGIRLQYGVSKVKDPGKDTSKNQRLDIWQETQDRARELQHNKNVALDVIAGDEVSIEGLTQAMQALSNIEATLEAVRNSPKTVTRGGRKITFEVFDQLQSSVEQLHQTFAHVLHDGEIANDNVAYLQAEVERLQGSADRAEKAEAKIAEAIREAERYRKAWSKEQKARIRYEGKYWRLAKTIDELKVSLKEMLQNLFDSIVRLFDKEARILHEVEEATGMVFEDYGDYVDWLLEDQFEAVDVVLKEPERQLTSEEHYR